MENKKENIKDVPLEIQKHFYRPICNEEEIERIFNIQNAQDYLLKLRADTIIDHMRLFRVYRNKAKEQGDKWSLERSFVSYHFTHFKNSLPPDLKQKCDENITHGNIFSNEVNGLIFPTQYGIITTISDSMKYFTEFMNLGLLDFKEEVPPHVRLNALRIAIRVMLQTEALDFKMDPRGIIPKVIQKQMRHTYPYQAQFLAGHEYAHFLLGHLDNAKIEEKHLFKAMFKNQEDYRKIGAYTISQKHEFEADLASINLPNYNDIEKRFIYEYALLWFAYLAIYEAVEDYLIPPFGYQTHPGAISRYQNLLDNVPKYKNFNVKYYVEDLPNIIDNFRDFFIEDIGYNCDFYEMYGSAYLDAPNTKWRGKELIDRVDYY